MLNRNFEKSTFFPFCFCPYDTALSMFGSNISTDYNSRTVEQSNPTLHFNFEAKLKRSSDFGFELSVLARLSAQC